MRARSAARVRPVVGHPSADRAQQEQRTRRRPGRDGRPTDRRAAAPGRAERRVAAWRASRGAGRTAAAVADPGVRRATSRRERVRCRRAARRGSSCRRPAAATAGEAVGGGVEHRPRARPASSDGASPAADAGLEERRAVQRPRRSADGRHEPMADGPQQLAGRRVGRQVGEHRLDGAEPDDEVVAVVTVAQHRIEPGQLARVALDDDPAAARARPGRRRHRCTSSAEVADGGGGTVGRR